MRYRDFKHKDLCDKIRQWREDRNISVTDIAYSTGYTRANIYNFEKGTNNNMDLLIWYMLHGFDMNKYFRGGED